MCGIAGFVGIGAGQLEEVAMAMATRLRHRGPDAFGLWKDSDVILAHTRLSIIDLSASGAQPMTSQSGRNVIVFNGEIYNHQDIRKDLISRGFVFRGRSDTEVLLEAIERLGLIEALTAAEGMFAFALWDRVKNRLFLARDRFGEKPLYYGWMGRQFLFASDLNAITLHPAFQAEIDATATSIFLARGYIPGPMSIFKGIHKLIPGTLAEVGPDAPNQVDIREYWNMSDVVLDCLGKPLRATPNELADQLQSLMSPVVRSRMEADVPLGLFLSGGLDSSLVAAFAQTNSVKPLLSFTAAFDDPRLDESKSAKAISEFLGTSHHELHISEAELLDSVVKMPTVFDEPFADASQIPTYALARSARNHVSVTLSGDGGDELFWGYRRFFRAMKFFGGVQFIPPLIRRLSGRAISRLPAPMVGGLGELLDSPSNHRFDACRMKRLARKLGQALAAPDFDSMRRGLESYWDSPVPTSSFSASPWATDRMPDFLPTASLERMAHEAAMVYLPDDVLVKVDRCSMAWGLEVRAPFLDRKLFEFSWKLPHEAKSDGSVGKIILRRLLGRFLPSNLFDREKMGFTPPVGRWLRGPLRDWAESHLSKTALAKTGILDAKAVRQCWQEHVDGREDRHLEVWSALMLQAWMEARRPLHRGHSVPSVGERGQ